MIDLIELIDHLPSKRWRRQLDLDLRFDDLNGKKANLDK